MKKKSINIYQESDAESWIPVKKIEGTIVEEKIYIDEDQKENQDQLKQITTTRGVFWQHGK